MARKAAKLARKETAKRTARLAAEPLSLLQKQEGTSAPPTVENSTSFEQVSLNACV